MMIEDNKENKDDQVDDSWLYQRASEMAREWREIRAQFPGIEIDDVECLVSVYYPIAVVEMELQEQTLEDMEGIERAVLELCRIGITDPAVITRTLGLGSSTTYITRIMRSLYGVGLLNKDHSLTNTASEALEEDRKIVTVLTRQLFQADALNGTLLRVDELVDEYTIAERTETRAIIGILDSADSAETSRLTEGLREDASRYIHRPEGFLNTNIIRIENVYLDHMAYARGYLLKLGSADHAIVLLKRYDRYKPFEKRTCDWRAMFVPPDDEDIYRPFVTEETPIATDVCMRRTDDLYQLLWQQQMRAQNDWDILRSLRWLYPFAEEGVEIGQVDAENQSVTKVRINEHAFCEYQPWILDCLIGLHQDNGYLYVDNAMYGYLMMLWTDSPLLQQAAALAADLALRENGLGRDGLNNILKRRYKRQMSDGETPPQDIQEEQMQDGLIEDIIRQMQQIRESGDAVYTDADVDDEERTDES